MDIITHSNRSKTDLDLFEFEASHHEDECTKWMIENWALGLYCSTIYLCAIFGGQMYMKNRPRYNLRYPLVAWSGTLAIFSMLGTARMAPRFFEDIFGKGLHYSLCDNEYMTTKPTSFWGYIFTISKIYEFGDTFFIVARKQTLIFLHYYHHVTVLLYVWHSFPQRLATSRWFALMNFAVHSLMYSYYTLRALKVKVPKSVNVVITFLQLLQMLVGLMVNIYTAYMLSAAVPCAINKPNLYWAFAMYISYFMLFIKFFCDTYMQQTKKKSPSMNEAYDTTQNGTLQTNGKLRNKFD